MAQSARPACGSHATGVEPEPFRGEEGTGRRDCARDTDGVGNPQPGGDPRRVIADVAIYPRRVPEGGRG